MEKKKSNTSAYMHGRTSLDGICHNAPFGKTLGYISALKSKTICSVKYGTDYWPPIVGGSSTCHTKTIAKSALNAKKGSLRMSIIIFGSVGASEVPGCGLSGCCNRTPQPLTRGSTYWPHS